jgi:hypothetical protein
MNAHASIPTTREAIHDRSWWAAEAERNDTGWDGIITSHLNVLAGLGFIESKPSSFELACKRADDIARLRKRGARR